MQFPYAENTLGWLIHERPLPGEEGDCKWYFSNLGEGAEPERLVELAHRRHEIERFYQDAKNELGFDHYEGRLWHGLHRHLTLVMWAYSWLAAKRRSRVERITDTDLPANAPGVAGFSPYRRIRDSIAAVRRSVLKSLFVAAAAWALYCLGPSFYHAFRM